MIIPTNRYVPQPELAELIRMHDESRPKGGSWVEQERAQAADAALRQRLNETAWAHGLPVLLHNYAVMSDGEIVVLT